MAKKPPTPKPRRSVEHGAYGVVAVTRGVHAGRVAYYDDDSDSGKSAYIYFDNPTFGQDRALIPFRNLGVATAAEVDTFEALQMNEFTAKRSARSMLEGIDEQRAMEDLEHDDVEVGMVEMLSVLGHRAQTLDLLMKDLWVLAWRARS